MPTDKLVDGIEVLKYNLPLLKNKLDLISAEQRYSRINTADAEYVTIADVMIRSFYYYGADPTGFWHKVHGRYSKVRVRWPPNV